MPHPNHLFVPRNPAGVHCVDRTMAAMEWDDLLCRYDGDRRAALRQLIADQGWHALDPVEEDEFGVLVGDVHAVKDALLLLDAGHGIDVVIERLRGWHQQWQESQEAAAANDAEAEQTRSPCPHCGGSGWVDD